MALRRFANVPPKTAFHPNLAMSAFLFGAIPPIPPIKIAIEEILANPHKANVTIAVVFADNYGNKGAILLNATNSFNINF